MSREPKVAKRRMCRWCKKALPLPRFATDGAGKHVEIPVAHDCVDHRRRLAGMCQDCNAPVDGKVKWALRCATHKLEAKREAARRSQDMNREERNAAWRARYARRPAMRRRKNEQRKAWKERNPERHQLHKRRDAIRNSERYHEYYRRYNAAHREKRLAYMKRYNVHQEPPKCGCCAAPIDWNGRGRPSRKCDTCDPRAARARDYKRQATVKVSA